MADRRKRKSNRSINKKSESSQEDLSGNLTCEQNDQPEKITEEASKIDEQSNTPEEPFKEEPTKEKKNNFQQTSMNSGNNTSNMQRFQEPMKKINSEITDIKRNAPTPSRPEQRSKEANGAHDQVQSHQSTDSLEDFELKFKAAVIKFHLGKEFESIPTYIKSCVILEALYERTEQLFQEFPKKLQQHETQFLVDMSIFFNYISLSMATQLCNFKKQLYQKVDEELHAKRSAEMARMFHALLKKNQTHWTYS